MENQFKTNLILVATENFALYPECYPCNLDGTPTEECEKALKDLAYGYHQNDGFQEYFSLEECEQIIKAEFKKSFLCIPIEYDYTPMPAARFNEILKNARVLAHKDGEFYDKIVIEYSEELDDFDVLVIDIDSRQRKYVGSFEIYLA